MTDGGGGRYELCVVGPAARQLDRLPEKIAAAVVEFMLGPLVDDPHRVGGALRGELTGLHAARRGAYRIVYEIRENTTTVIVFRIDHRSTVYRSRRTRCPITGESRDAASSIAGSMTGARAR